MTFYERYFCLRKFSEDIASLSFQECDCPFQCKEITYAVKWNLVQRYGVRWGKAYWEIFFRMPNFNVRKVTELPDYTIFDLLAELGGYLGLFSGTSALSIIEVVALLLISIVVIFKKKNSVYEL